MGQGLSCNGEPSVCDVCGNGDVGGTEECDDGNLDDGDTCTSVCTIPVEQCNESLGACGERIVDDGYDGSIASMTCLAREIASTGVDRVLSVDEVRVAAVSSFVGDLTIKLVSPSGTIVAMMSRPGLPESVDGQEGNCCGDSSDWNAATVTFTPGAATSAEDMGAGIDGGLICVDDGVCDYAPNPGVVQPDHGLEAYIGEASNGIWRLCIGDAAGGDLAAFTSWDIALTRIP